MMKLNITIVIIEDQDRFKEDALVWVLNDKFEEVSFFTNPDDGLKYIANNQLKRMIILLDIDFNRKSLGHELLDKIRVYSDLIPVILWSGIDEHKETFNDFINNHAFGFIKKDSTIEFSLKIINNAVNYLNTSIDKAIEEWIEIHPESDKNKLVYRTADGKSFTLNEILLQIRMQTPEGKEYAKRLTKLTVDLLMRNKESVND